MSASPRIALVHALAASMEPASDAFRTRWPEARVDHLLDDALSRDLAAAGSLDARMVARFLTLGRYVVTNGADAVLYTCSAFDPAIDRVRRALPVPVVAPTEALVDEVLDAPGPVAVLATFEPTLRSLERVIDSRGGGGADLRFQHVDAALAALERGSPDQHDAAIARAAAAAAAEGATVVALAQFSMARAAPGAERAAGVRVLTTPLAAVDRLRARLGGAVPPLGRAAP